jgi:hypothetical protein
LRRTSLSFANVRQSPGTTSSTVQMDSGGSRSGDQLLPEGPVAKHKGLVEILWTLRNLPEVATIKETSTNGVVASLPAVSNKLWDTPLPAAQRLHPWLQMRGASLKDGFRVTQPAGWVCYIATHRHGNPPTRPKSNFLETDEIK